MFYLFYRFLLLMSFSIWILNACDEHTDHDHNHEHSGNHDELEEACIHLNEESEIGVTASQDNSAELIAISESHTRYAIALPPSEEVYKGTVALNISEAGAYQLFISIDTMSVAQDFVLSVVDLDQQAVQASKIESSLTCEDQEMGFSAYTYELAVGQYELSFTSSVEVVKLVMEELHAE